MQINRIIEKSQIIGVLTFGRKVDHKERPFLRRKMAAKIQNRPASSQMWVKDFKKSKNVDVSSYEIDGHLYTLKTLNHFKEEYPKDDIYFIMRNRPFCIFR